MSKANGTLLLGRKDAAKKSWDVEPTQAKPTLIFEKFWDVARVQLRKGNNYGLLSDIVLVTVNP